MLSTDIETHDLLEEGDGFVEEEPGFLSETHHCMLLSWPRRHGISARSASLHGCAAYTPVFFVFGQRGVRDMGALDSGKAYGSNMCIQGALPGWFVLNAGIQ